MDSNAYMAQCQDHLRGAVAALGGNAQAPGLGEIADLIIRSMTGPWRSFHTPEHIFDVGRGGSPIEVIAALFHDLVYVQVDSGIHVNLSRYLAPYVREDQQALLIDAEPEAKDIGMRLAMALFGFQTGQALSPFAGQNEFLSAVVAVKALEGLLHWRDLARVVVCIEATIPFRGPMPDGRDCSEHLHERLLRANTDFALGLSPAQCTEAIEMGVRVANRDISNFGSEDPAEFLNNTWNLIPETNHELVNANTYTVQGYRVSLQKMEGFLGFLQPDRVFRCYGQEPSPAEHQHRLAMTRRNLAVAVQYLRVKLVSIGLLEALSRRIGPDVALASLMGTLSAGRGINYRMEQHLPPVANPHRPNGPTETCVMALLETGRSADSLHDARHSPVSSFLVKSLGMDAVLALLPTVQQFFKDPEQAEVLLQACPLDTLSALQHAVATVYSLRTQALAKPVTCA